MRNDRAEHVALIGRLAAARNVPQSSLAFELGEHVFLRSAAFEETRGFFDGAALVGDDALVGVLKFQCLEKVQLESSFTHGAR